MAVSPKSAPRRQISSFAWARLADDFGPATRPEGLRVSRYGYGRHWGPESVQGFRAFNRHCSARHRYPSTALDLVLDQHGGGGDSCDCVTGEWTGSCDLLSRSPHRMGDCCPGGWISLQWGRGATFSASPTSNALHGFGRNRYCFPPGEYCCRNVHGYEWLWVLGPGGNDGDGSSHLHC